MKKRIIAKSSECQKFVGVKASLKFKFGWKKPEKTTFEPETQGTGSFPRYLLTEINQSLRKKIQYIVDNL